MKKYHVVNLTGRKFAPFLCLFLLSTVIFTDFRALLSAEKVLKFQLSFEGKPSHKGLYEESKNWILPEIVLKWTRIVILVKKNLKVAKIKIQITHLNPLWDTVAIWQPEYQVSLMTSQHLYYWRYEKIPFC